MNTLTLFVIRRKADGMFVGSGRNFWIKSIAKARTFKSKSGAKTSRSWHEFKDFLTGHACEVCKNSKYGNWNHKYTKDRPNTRYYGKSNPKETMEQWIAKNNKLPCFIRRRLTVDENPLEIVPVTFTVQN